MLKELIGDRKKYFLSINAIRERGGFTTLSSDWDVSSLNPFIGIEHATTRGKYQSVSVKDAIEMYTINPAFAMRQEDKVGSLVVGKEADFIVIDQDILKTRTCSISDTNVLQTVFKGNAVYTSGRFSRYVTDVMAEKKQHCSENKHHFCYKYFHRFHMQQECYYGPNYYCNIRDDKFCASQDQDFLQFYDEYFRHCNDPYWK